MEWLTLPIIEVPNSQQPTFRATTDCPYWRLDMILIGVFAGAALVYLIQRGR